MCFDDCRPIDMDFCVISRRHFLVRHEAAFAAKHWQEIPRGPLPNPCSAMDSAVRPLSRLAGPLAMSAQSQPCPPSRARWWVMDG